MMAALFVAPLFLQTRLGLTATQSGLVTMWHAAGMLVVLPFADALFQRIGPRRMLLAGFGLVTVSQAILALVDSRAGLLWMGGAMVLLGVGGAMSIVPLNAATFSGISVADTARASAIFSTSRQVASGISVAVMATLLAVSTQLRIGGMDSGASESARTAAAIGAFHDVFWAGAAIGVLGLLLTLLVRDSDAAASRRTPRQRITTLPTDRAARTRTNEGRAA